MGYDRSVLVRHRDWRALLVELALLLGLTGVAAVAFGRSLRSGALYDEGVYLASLDALEHGQKLGSQVFASQPPGFYVLLEAERAVFGGSVVAIRVAMLLLALGGCVAAYFIGRRLAGPRGGFFAMALLVTPLSLEDEAVRVRADFPSVALSLVAMLGLYAGVLGQLWTDAFRFHVSAQSASIRGAPTSLAGNVTKLARALTDYGGLRSPFLWLAVVGALATLFAWHRRRLLGAFPLWLWVACAAVFLSWHRPLWSHDVTVLIVALAIAGGVGLAALLVEPRRASRVAAALCAVVIAASIAHHAQRTSAGESTGVKWAVGVLRARTRIGSHVASDVPIIPFLADRLEPDMLVDTSSTRIGSGWLTRSTILGSLERARVSAVVVGNNFALDPRLVQAIHRRFPLVLSRYDVTIPGRAQRVSLRIYLPRRR